MNKKSYILGIGLSILLIMSFITIIRSRPASVATSSDLTSTAIPPDILTKIALNEANISATQTAYPPFATQFVQTEQALQLTLAAAPRKICK